MRWERATLSIGHEATGNGGLTLGCVTMLDLVLLFLVTLVVVFNTLATFSMLLEANLRWQTLPYALNNGWSHSAQALTAAISLE